VRALILWSNPTSTNLGVRALAAGSAALVVRAFGPAEVAFQGFGPGDAPVRIGDGRRLARRLLTPRDELIDWLRGFDLVVDTRAGDSFADIYGLTRHLTMSLMHQAVLRSGTPVVLGPQTIGPFTSNRGRLLARHTARTARVVMSRDQRSEAVALELGARRSVLTTDVVFALDVPQEADRQRDVLFNVSGLLWNPNPHVDHVRYRDTVRNLVAELGRRGRRVSLLAHVLDSPVVDNDVPVVEALSGELGVEAVVPRDLDAVRSVARSADLVIGSRMHACLNAISVGTPAIPLAYSRKFSPLLDAVGWPHTVDQVGAAAPADDVLAIIDTVDLEANVAQVRDRALELVERATRALESAI
jgi:polysaccharide pyruvyl transferase WcaK-like protein